MAVEDFGGKVLGKPIEVLVADHQNKPDAASALARKWFDVDKVDMIANLINRRLRSAQSRQTGIRILGGELGLSQAAIRLPPPRRARNRFLESRLCAAGIALRQEHVPL